MTAPKCAEIVTFRLVDGTSQSDFLESAKETVPLIKDMPGFVSRTLTVDDDGVTWTDYVVWADRASSLQANDLITQDPRFATFGGAIDMSTLVMKHSDIML